MNCKSYSLIYLFNEHHDANRAIHHKAKVIQKVKATNKSGTVNQDTREGDV